MARFLIVAVLLVTYAALCARAEEGSLVFIKEGCNATAQEDVCSTCVGEPVEYNANGECHKYDDYKDNSYKVGADGALLMYPNDNCESLLPSKLNAAPNCTSNITSAYIVEPLDPSPTSVTVGFCLAPVSVPCSLLKANNACFPLNLTITSECKKAPEPFTVAYTATVTDGALDLKVYYNMAECMKKRFLVFSSPKMTGFGDDSCNHYQPRYNYTVIGTPGPVPTTTSTGVFAQSTLVAALALVVAAYLICF